MTTASPASTAVLAGKDLPLRDASLPLRPPMLRLCPKEGKPGVRCEVDGIGTLFLDWKCLPRMVALKSSGAKPQQSGIPVETR